VAIIHNFTVVALFNCTQVENVFGQSKTFFEKERETKLKYEKSSIAGIDSWNGYTGLGAEAFELEQNSYVYN